MRAILQGPIGSAWIVFPSAPEPPVISRREAIAQLRQLPQRAMPLTHRFQEGVYIREIFMPGDTFVVGAVHKTRHFNIILAGRAIVSMNGGPTKIVQAGDCFESDAGVQKWLYIQEDTRWITIHANPSNSQDIAALEEAIVELDPEFKAAKGFRTLDEFRMSVNEALTVPNNP
jgi:mannose-6-phosphate isomerase-like protein (cupin superfamily)